MSFDVAIWPGELPPSDEEAGRIFGDQIEEFEGVTRRDPRLVAFVAELTAEYPDDCSQDSPWNACPLEDEISGSFMLLPMTWPGVDRALGFLIETARKHGLVCYDPQFGRRLLEVLRPVENAEDPRVCQGGWHSGRPQSGQGP